MSDSGQKRRNDDVDRDGSRPDEGEELATKSAERDEELLDDVDELLDEIDDVLESNAEEFVRGYVQKGGE